LERRRAGARGAAADHRTLEFALYARTRKRRRGVARVPYWLGKNAVPSMVDTLSRLERSIRMSLIRSKDTQPELVVRRAVWAAGFRYRLHGRGLPGKPDLVFPALKTVVFVNGCYWHGHSCQKGRIPGQNSSFWRDKFAANKERDRRNTRRLRRDGWSAVTVWECSLATAKKRERTIRHLLDLLNRRREDTVPGAARRRRAR